MWRFSFWGIKPLQTRTFILREESLRFGHKINVFFFFFFGWVLLDFPVLRFFLFPLKALGNFLHITSLSLSSFSWFDRASYHFLVKKPSSFFSWGLKKRLYLTTYWLLLFVWTCLLEIWRSFPVWWFSSVTFAGKKKKKKSKFEPFHGTLHAPKNSIGMHLFRCLTSIYVGLGEVLSIYFHFCLFFSSVFSTG